MTKREIYVALKEIPENAEFVEFFESEIEKIDARNEKEKVRRAKKKEQSDILKKKIATLLTSEPQTADTIVEKLLEGAEADEQITKNMVTSRLGSLIKDGLAEKKQGKIDDKRVMTYAAPGTFGE